LGRGWGEVEEMTQALYAHMNNKKIKIKTKTKTKTKLSKELHR
jgi:hypothetical protein